MTDATATLGSTIVPSVIVSHILAAFLDMATPNKSEPFINFAGMQRFRIVQMEAFLLAHS